LFRVNNSVIFSGNPIGSGEFLNQIVETLDINIWIDVPKEELVKEKAKP